MDSRCAPKRIVSTAGSICVKYKKMWIMLVVNGVCRVIGRKGFEQKRKGFESMF